MPGTWRKFTDRNRVFGHFHSQMSLVIGTWRSTRKAMFRSRYGSWPVAYATHVLELESIDGPVHFPLQHCSCLVHSTPALLHPPNIPLSSSVPRGRARGGSSRIVILASIMLFPFRWLPPRCLRSKYNTPQRHCGLFLAGGVQTATPTAIETRYTYLA